MELKNNSLLDYEYYLRRMSMFLSESVGIKERINYFVQIMETIVGIYDNLFNDMDIFNTSGNLNKTYLNASTSTTSSVLDSIGAIFGCGRNISLLEDASVPYPTTTANKSSWVNQYVTLTNEEYLCYIIVEIARQHFQGTREELLYLYGDSYNDVPGKINEILGENRFSFIYANDGTLNVKIIWDIGTTDTSATTTLRYMFLNGLLNIESLGITYDYIIEKISSIGIFDTSERSGDEGTTEARDTTWG